MKMFALIFVIVYNSNAQANQQFIATDDSIESTRNLPYKRSLTGAIIFETLIPTSGFLYAGNWKKGILPQLTKFTGFYLTVTQVEFGLFDNDTKIKNGFLFTSGLLMTIGGLVWTYASLTDVVYEYNNSHQVKLAPSVNKNGSFKVNLLYNF